MCGNLKEDLFKHPEKILQIVLGLVAIHSLGIGLALIAQPAVLIKFEGFSPDCDHFFPAQGGVFHLPMFVVYFMGATHIEEYHYFIIFSIFVKSFATFFLMVYSFTAKFKWIVFLIWNRRLCDEADDFFVVSELSSFKKIQHWI